MHGMSIEDLNVKVPVKKTTCVTLLLYQDDIKVLKDALSC
jgi:hypothetical protein